MVIAVVERLVAGLVRTDGLRPDPGTARDWLHRELAGGEYQRSLLQRFLDWLSQRSTGNHRVSGNGGVSLVSTLIIVGVLVAIAVFVVARLRRDRGRAGRGRSESAAVGAVDSLTEHRARAATALAAGRYGEAVVEGVRAIARQLVDREVLPDDPGTTAYEVAVAAGAAFPDHAVGLRSAATVFDRVQYGGLDADHTEAEQVIALDAAVERARPVRGTTVTSLVPR